MRFDVCVVGSANLDLVATTDRLPAPGETVLGSEYAEHPGGKGLNQAVAAARSGARVSFVGAVGDDAAGAELRVVVADEGIDATLLAEVRAPTGRALILVDRSGENSIVVVPGANAHVTMPSQLPECEVVLVQREIPPQVVLAALITARQRGATTVLNPAPAASIDIEVLGHCDVVVPNEHEIVDLGGPQALLAAGCRAVVVTKGGDGVDVYTADASPLHLPAFAVDVVDTTGAGDAFCGSLAARLAAGDELPTAVRWASAAGALATTVRGAVPAQPHRAAILALLARDQPAPPG